MTVSSIILCPGSVDCSYNVLWIILSQAIEDFGVKEVKDAVQATTSAMAPTPPSSNHVSTSNEPSSSHAIVAPAPAQVPRIRFDTAAGPSLPEGVPQSAASMIDLERSVANDAFNGATRIAGLVSARLCLLELSPQA